MSLDKIIYEKTIEPFLHPIFYTIKLTKNTMYLLDYKYRIRQILIKTVIRIPQNFINHIVFISSSSFQQNNCNVKNKIRKSVFSFIKNSKNILAIGGESYLYGLISNCDYMKLYTNSESINQDFIFNNQIYKKHAESQVVNYNQLDIILNKKYDVIINLSKINLNLIKWLNQNKKMINSITIISCGNYQRINKLDFRLKNIKHFIDEKIKKLYAIYNLENSQ